MVHTMLAMIQRRKWLESVRKASCGEEGGEGGEGGVGLHMLHGLQQHTVWIGLCHMIQRHK